MKQDATRLLKKNCKKYLKRLILKQLQKHKKLQKNLTTTIRTKRKHKHGGGAKQQKKLQNKNIEKD